MCLFFSGGYVNSTISKAVAKQTNAEESLQAVRRDLDVNVHNKYRGVIEGAMRMRTLEQAVRFAVQMMRFTQMYNKAGPHTQLDEFNVQQQYKMVIRE
jgi:protease secretion system outer membrane protein